jgi:hypothetical protein
MLKIIVMKLKSTRIDNFFKGDTSTTDVSIDQAQNDPKNLEDEMDNWLPEENDDEEEEIVQSAAKVRRIDCADNSVLNVERDPGLLTKFGVILQINKNKLSKHT